MPTPILHTLDHCPSPIKFSQANRSRPDEVPVEASLNKEVKRLSYFRRNLLLDHEAQFGILHDPLQIPHHDMNQYLFGEDFGFYHRFFVCDTATGDKNPAPLKWVAQQAQGFI